ncbi:MAG: hypothetical protein AABZ31_08315 [Bdellovibrionota bacterium]
MRKVNLFATLFTALLLTVFSLTAAEAKVYKNTDKIRNDWAETKPGKVKMSKGLQTITYDQLASMNDKVRAQYIAAIRKAALDLDKIQRSFKGLHVVALNAQQQQEDMYAYADAIDFLFGPEAQAQSAADRNQCIYALGLSKYPDDQVKDGRAPFQCILRECTYGKRIKGVKCGWTASGLVNKADVGCLPIGNATNAIDKTHASQACWEQRGKLEQRNRSAVEKLVADTNKFFGFPSGTIKSNACQSDTARDYMNELIRSSYSNKAYGTLAKVAYFCQVRGGGMPDGLIEPEAGGALTFKNLTDSWDGLRNGAKEIFAAIENHCKAPLADSVIKDIETGANLKKVAKNTEPYQMELDRQEYLKQARANGWTVNSATVLEVEECKHAFFTYEALNNELKDLEGTLPRIDDGTPTPEVPPGPTNNEIVDVEPTGCTENVAKDESQLAQAAARCMPCMIQAHEARKTGEGTYRPSRKFLSLMSTMALACGDGLVNDTSVNPKLMMDYWMAFGHCSSTNYEWRGTEDKSLVEAWAEKKGKSGFWRSGKGAKDASTNPDRGGAFAKAYGLTLDTAKQLFCDSKGRKYNYSASSSEKARFIKERREQFNREKRVLERGQENSIADNLMVCMNEASANATAFHSGSGMCYAFGDTNSGNALASATADWLGDGKDSKTGGYPTVLNRGGACYIAKQVERYKLGCNGADVCYDKNRDGKDDKSGCACGAPATFLVYVDPGFNDKEYRVRVEARENGQLVPDVARRPGQKSTDAESIAYRDDNACMISSADAKAISRPGSPAGSTK